MWTRAGSNNQKPMISSNTHQSDDTNGTYPGRSRADPAAGAGSAAAGAGSAGTAGAAAARAAAAGAVAAGAAAAGAAAA